MELNESNEQFDAVQKEICLSGELMDLIRDERYACWEDFEYMGRDRSDIPRFKPKRKLKEFQWLWGLDKGVRYYFVPKSFIPHAVEPSPHGRTVARCL